MKKILALLLSLCLLLSLGACGETTSPEPVTTAAPTTQSTEPATQPTTPPEPEPEPDSISPILYKITDDAGNVLWLFGSIHVGQDRFYPLPDYVNTAYKSADVLAVEADILAIQDDTAAMMEAIRPLIYIDGTTISDHLSEELYTAAVETMKECKIYNKAMDYYCPAMWYSLISSSVITQLDVDAELGIDMHFLERAHEEDKTIVEIESAQLQYAMLANFSDELQSYLLAAALEEYADPDQTAESLNQLVDAWATGDEALLTALLHEEVEFENEEEKALYEEYNTAMTVDRNIAMADFAQESLGSGQEVFICVGAAHVLGEGAIVDLLTQRGYTAQRIEISE